MQRAPLALVCVLVACAAAAQEPLAPFDGRSLAGWEGDPRCWTVEDGCLVGRSSEAEPLVRTTYLVWTARELRDFELTLSYRIVRGSSGVQFRSRTVGRDNVAGYQVELAPDSGLSGSLVEPFGRGTLARRGERTEVASTGKPESQRFASEESFRALERPRDWNELRIRAVGERCEVFLNGVRTAELVDRSPLRASLSGSLALELPSGEPAEVRFRDLALVDLGGVHDARERFEPLWIWTHEEAGPDEEAWFQRGFELAGPARRATLHAVADDGFEAYLNGELVAAGEGTDRVQQVDVTAALRAGSNRIALWARNEDGLAAVYCALQIEGDGWKLRFGTDASWRGSRTEPSNWTHAGDDPAWGAVQGFGPVGTEPWGKPSFQVRHARVTALSGTEIALPSGFTAELVYSVPRGRQGSWVALCFDPQGRAYTSDQHGFLYRVELGATASETRAERLGVALGEAQGLCWAFDALYVVVNGSKRFASGLYRVTDSDGDDRLDRVECLRALRGSDEHGPHAVVPAPDGSALYVIGGNEVEPPDEALERWGPSFLPVGRLPVCVQHLDVTQVELTQRGSAGWIARTDPGGKDWELVATGLRNAYDLAFGPGGELFTFDSDMEWDLGLPWYVPTRLLHVVPRADFGFRIGSARWPTWFPDSLPGVVDVGRTSPTGMLAGAELAFPARYRRALFAGDWLKGRILAFHLEPLGASFGAEVETFASGRPLPVTDLAAGPDGALYFVTGGRQTQSGLYRIVGHGAPDAEPARDPEEEPVDEARALAILQRVLKASAPFERHAMRVQLAARPWQELRDRRQRLESREMRVEFGLACARAAPAEEMNALLLELASDLPIDSEDETLTGTVLRTLEVALLRASEVAPETRARLATDLLVRFPLGRRELDRELGVLLASLPEAEERFVPRALERLLGAGEGVEAFHWALLLRHARRGWTTEGRAAYFRWLRSADESFGGGRGVAVFLEGLRRDALATLTDEERAALGALVEPGVAAGFAAGNARRFVQAWTVADLEPDLSALEGQRDLVRGARLLVEAGCLTCHRIEGRGRALGPELDGLVGRYSAQDLLESLLEPSREVPERYRDTVITTRDERVHAGRIVGGDDETLLLRESGERAVSMPRAEIATQELSPISPMPEGLLDVYGREEILDLLAYLLQDV